MYAIIGTRDGEFYHSAVFGFTAGMYIVFDRDKTHLILQQGDDHGVMTLITDTDRSDWELDTKGNGFVSYFAGRRINWHGEILLTSDDMKFCRAYDNGNPYREWQPVETEKDTDNFLEATAGLHDARITDCKTQDGQIRLLFQSVWGFDLEVILSDDVSFRMSGQVPDVYGWQDASVLFSDGYVYLMENQHITADTDLPGFSWFRGRHMTYHIIPKLGPFCEETSGDRQETCISYWIHRRRFLFLTAYECSVCGKIVWRMSASCPACGAAMEEH